MAKRLLVGVIILWAVGVVLSLAGGIGHLIVLVLIALLLAGLTNAHTHNAERRADRS
jgi:hypothetical protein